mgnify:CR=1 FL=1
MGSIIRTMDNLIEKMNQDEVFKNKIGKEGIIVMGRHTMREFRGETERPCSRHKGHKIRMLKACPDNSIYLMAKEDYIQLKYEIGISKN